jgi:murein DD-endopeptidase MepM/ murein hydrolase activator NlpD
MKSPNLTPGRMFSASYGFLSPIVAALLRRAGRIGLAAAVVVGLGVGFVLGGQAGAVGPLEPPPMAALPPPIASPPPIAVDLDGDGRFDLARPVEHAVRGVDAYGSGAFGASRDGGRRAHHGVDFIAAPGEPIRAPIAGVVTRVGAAYAGQDALQYVEIANTATRYTARVLYIGPAVQLGWTVAAGDVIGRAQDLGLRYPAGMTNHVHVELTGGQGGRLDPLVVLPNVSDLSGRPMV